MERHCFSWSIIFDEDAVIIADFYRKRWDIEVFLRFIKPELSFSHFYVDQRKQNQNHRIYGFNAFYAEFDL